MLSFWKLRSTMKLIFALLSISLTSGRIAPNSYCHACFDGVCYNKARINNTHNISGQIAIDRVANIIHFHYEERNVDHTSAYDLKEIKWRELPGIGFSFARTVDQSRRDIYIGGAKGILKYNPVKNLTTRIGLFDKTIWHMHFKEKIFFTEFMARGLYVFENMKTKSVAPLSKFDIDDFIIDKRDDIYFTSNFTTYRLKKGDTKASIFSNLTYNLATDIWNNAYFIQTSNKGLYRMDYNDGKLSMVGAFASGVPFKIVFDSLNNIIYYDPGEQTLFYLTPNYGKCRVVFDVKKKYRKNNNIGKTFTLLPDITRQQIRNEEDGLEDLNKLIILRSTNESLSRNPKGVN